MTTFLLTMVIVLNDSTTSKVDYPRQASAQSCAERGRQIQKALAPTNKSYALCIEMGK